MKRVMLDFETLGNGKNACVVQVGACYFTDYGEIGATFKHNVDARDALDNGAELDADTVYWWLGQSEEARQSILAEPKGTERAVFNLLNEFLAEADEIWSHATFDFVILVETMKRLGIKRKFHYQTARDIRTLTSLCPPRALSPRRGVHHDGLDDAIYQAGYVAHYLGLFR